MFVPQVNFFAKSHWESLRLREAPHLPPSFEFMGNAEKAFK
jgi:hypothetical protein